MTGPDGPHPTDPPEEQSSPGEEAAPPGEASGVGTGTPGAESSDGTPARPHNGAWDAGGRSGGREHQGAYDAGAVRALRGDIEDLRSELRRGLSGTREQLRDEFRSGLGESNGYIAELLPRVHDLENRVAALLAGGAPTATGTDTSDSTDAAAEAAEADDEAPVTPATGWDAMDRAAAENAWTALAEFVDTVLYRQYRLTRLQIPDCWPVHPRMVRELAWLRSSYLEAQQEEVQAPAASLPWHIRAIPGFLINTADAVDTRECRPGVHRLTDPEVSRYATQRMTARHESRPDPTLTRETGPDRPQLHPERYPTRTTSTAAAPQDGAEPKAPTAVSLPELIVGACHPENWIGYYREASTADLADRPD